MAFPFSRASSQPRDRTQVSRIAGGFCYQLSHKQSPLEHSKHPVNAPGLNGHLGPWNLQHHLIDHLSIWIQLFKNVSLWSKADGGCAALSIAPSPTFSIRGCRVQAKAVIGTPKNPTPLPFLPFFSRFTHTHQVTTLLFAFSQRSTLTTVRMPKRKDRRSPRRFQDKRERSR